MRKVISTLLAAVAGLLGLTSVGKAENPYYDPDYDLNNEVYENSAYDPDAPDFLAFTFEGVTPTP